MESVANASFQTPTGWSSGHLQTVRAQLRPGSFPLESLGLARQIIVDLDDGTGDRLSVIVHRSNRPQPTNGGRDAGVRLVVLIHGLGGSAESTYVMSTAHALLRAGFNVARLDLRGAGLSKEMSRNFYHAGKTEDVRRVLYRLASEPEALDDSTRLPSLGVVGFSLGGNVAIKLLGEPLPGLERVAGVAISAPLDLQVGSGHLSRAAFGGYEKYILRSLKRDSLQEFPGRGARVSADERRLIEQARDLADFDNALTAPRNGWQDATEYYRINSSGPFLASVERPLLVIHSLDDPMIPASPYQAIDWVELERAGFVSRAIAERGGHVGFHERGRRYRWFTPLIVNHLRASSARWQ